MQQTGTRKEERAASEDGRRFRDIEARSTVDYALRTVQQSLVQFSALADAKANILVSISALVFTISLTQLDRSPFRAPLIVLLLGSAVALVLAVLCAMPGKHHPTKDRLNRLFFLHIAALPLDRYLDEMDALLSDGQAVTDAIVRDIHAQSQAIARSKYRYLRWSYLTLVASFCVGALGIAFELCRRAA